MEKIDLSKFINKNAEPNNSIPSRKEKFLRQQARERDYDMYCEEIINDLDKLKTQYYDELQSIKNNRSLKLILKKEDDLKKYMDYHFNYYVENEKDDLGIKYNIHHSCAEIKCIYRYDLYNVKRFVNNEFSPSSYTLLEKVEKRTGKKREGDGLWYTFIRMIPEENNFLTYEDINNRFCKICHQNIEPSNIHIWTKTTDFKAYNNEEINKDLVPLKIYDEVNFTIKHRYKHEIYNWFIN